MYVIIRRFSRVASVTEAARRAETGIGQLLKHSAGFRGYYVFDAGEGGAGSVTLFETREDAMSANEKVMAWIRASLADLIDGEPDIITGDVLATVLPDKEVGSYDQSVWIGERV